MKNFVLMFLHTLRLLLAFTTAVTAVLILVENVSLGVALLTLIIVALAVTSFKYYMETK